MVIEAFRGPLNKNQTWLIKWITVEGSIPKAGPSFFAAVGSLFAVFLVFLVWFLGKKTRKLVKVERKTEDKICRKKIVSCVIGESQKNKPMQERFDRKENLKKKQKNH